MDNNRNQEQPVDGAAGTPAPAQSAQVYQRRVLETAMYAGNLLLESGAEIFRVEETIDRICKFYQIESESAFILSNGIFMTAGGEKEAVYARVRHIPVQGAKLYRVAEVNQLSREIEEGRYTIEEVRERLEAIRGMPGKSKKMQILASGVGSACFCYMFGGSLLDSVGTFFAGLALYLYVLEISRPHLSKIIGTIGGGALLTACCLLLYRLHIGVHLNQMIIGAVMPLVPGLAFTNGIRDIADGDYISGAVRMLDALLVFFCIAIGVGIVIMLYYRFTGGMPL